MMQKIAIYRCVSLFTLLFLFQSNSRAIDFYWVGGNGVWSDFFNHWATTSGGSSFHTRVPSAIDNVIFDGNSFTATGQLITVDLAVVQMGNMDWTGVKYTPTFTGSSEKSLRIYGSLKLAPAMNYLYDGIVNFNAATVGNTITLAGNAFRNDVYFRGAGGEWTFADAFTVVENTAVSAIRFFNGTINTNGKSITTPLFYSFDGGTSRTLNLGTSVVTITGNTWSVEGPNVLVNGGESLILLPFGGMFRSVAGSTYNSIKFSENADAGSGIINGERTTVNGAILFFKDGSVACDYNTFNGDIVFNSSASFTSDNWNTNNFNGNVNLRGNGQFGGGHNFNNIQFAPGFTYTLQSSASQKLKGQLYASGTGSQPIQIQASTPGQWATILKTSGNICLDYVWMSDIAGSGGAVFNAGKAPERSLDLGGNIGWIFSGGCSSGVLPVNVYSFTSHCLLTKETELRWRVGTEVRPSDITVQKSKDGRTFNSIAKVKLEGTEPQDYRYTDREVSRGKTFYRLMQTGANGQSIYSGTIAAMCSEERSDLHISPNPSSGIVRLSLPNQFSKAVVVVYNNVGNRVYQKTERNSSFLTVNLSSHPKGIYFLQLEVDGECRQEKIILQ